MWEELYKRHHTELVRYAANVCKDPDLAEDVAQEVFLRALQSADVLEDLGPNQRRAWLFRTLKNYIFDCFRRAKLENEYLETVREEDISMDPGMQETENRILMASLTPEDRMLFHLRYEEGYNASELSQMLGIPPGTIRAKLSRCRTILKN